MVYFLDPARRQLNPRLTGRLRLIYSVRRVTEWMLGSSKRDNRTLAGESVAVLIATWTGYFLAHTWQTLNRLELAGLLLGAGVLYLLAAQALAVRARRWAAVVICGAGAFGAVSTRLPVSAVAVWLTAALIGYLALAAALRGGRPISQRAFTWLLIALLLAILALGGWGLRRPYGLEGAMLLAWLAVRVGGFGRYVLRRGGPGRLDQFAKGLLVSAGILAGALLTFKIETGRRAIGELAWPMVSVVAAIVLARLWSYMGEKEKPPRPQPKQRP